MHLSTFWGPLNSDVLTSIMQKAPIHRFRERGGVGGEVLSGGHVRFPGHKQLLNINVGSVSQ